ncbi:unnamed protein product, partial [Mesorhabditis belari]|uniref:Uncharacterized protein n=1 Tax=Mesorhabditis belari TaxID=2138241 RepID=A0AAF3EU78_9BILA
MAFFGRIFRPKNHRKEDKENENQMEPRDAYERKSMRSSISQRNRKDKHVQYENDLMSATAAYHVPTQPKNYRGPRSLPGGSKYQDDYNNALNRSFESNFYDSDRRSRRPPKDLSYHKYGRARSNYETSEYGSQDPSPVGESSRMRAPYATALDDDSDEEYTKKEKIITLDHSLKMAMSENKRLKEALYKKNKDCENYKDQLKKQERMQQLLEEKLEFQQKTIEKLGKYKRHYLAQQENSQQQYFPNHFGFGMPHSGRHSLVPNPMFHSYSHQSQHTPSTSAMDSFNGAGEALTSDVSIVSPQDNPLLIPFGALTMNQTGPLSSATQNFQHNSANSPTKVTPADVTLGQNIVDDEDEEKDDVKVFRQNAYFGNTEENELNLEVTRADSGRSNTPIPDEQSLTLREEMYSAHSTLTRSNDESDTAERSSSMKKSLSTDL